MALGEGGEVGRLPGGLVLSNPISSHDAQLGKPEVSTLPSFADEIRDKGMAKNFCSALF